MYSTEIEIRVLYAHTDKMGIVYYARYFEYFEAGRNDMLRKIGYPYTKLEENNIALPVIESHCEYSKSVYYDEVIKIKSTLKEIPGVRIKIFYEVYRDNEILAQGHTIHSFVNFEKMKPARPPEDLIKLIKEKINN